MVVDFTLSVELQEQIVVTALRRAERLQDVPATVDAFDAGMIEQAGITSMRDYVGMAPQITLVETQNIGFAFVNVRGLSQVRNSEPTSPSSWTASSRRPAWASPKSCSTSSRWRS